jgi:hypothetical protein
MKELGVVHIEKAQNMRILWSCKLKYLHSVIALFIPSRVLKVYESNEHGLPQQLLDAI